jgi:hypothetical protein
MELNLSPFEIEIRFSKAFTFKVQQSYILDNIEIFTLTYRNRELQFQSDRPFIRKNGGRKKINWKVIKGKVENEANYERIKQELESYIKRIEKPPFNWKDHPKNS